MKIEFKIYGKPKGWQRAGYNHRKKIMYTQNQTRNTENLIAYTYKSLFKKVMFSGNDYIKLSIFAYFPVPKSVSKKRAQLMLCGDIRPTCKPDNDNIGKLVADALNKVAYKDDKNIVDMTIKKYYGEEAYTLIVLEKIDKTVRGIT